MPVSEEAVVHLLLKVFDLLGTYAFAISGAIAAAKQKLDLFGVLVLSSAATSVVVAIQLMRWPAQLLRLVVHHFVSESG